MVVLAFASGRCWISEWKPWSLKPVSVLLSCTALSKPLNLFKLQFLQREIRIPSILHLQVVIRLKCVIKHRKGEA